MAKRTTVSGTVADPNLQFATLTIGGKQYPLAYNFNAIAEAEHEAGCNLLSGLENLTDLTAKQLRGLLYAALRVAHPETVIEQAGELIRLDTIAPVTAALATAYRLSMPDRKPADPPAASAQSNSQTGSCGSAAGR